MWHLDDEGDKERFVKNCMGSNVSTSTYSYVSRSCLLVMNPSHSCRPTMSEEVRKEMVAGWSHAVSLTHA